MIDPEWLKNLALANYRDGAWTVADPSAIQRLAETRVAAAIVALEEEARDAAEVHNNYAPHNRHIRVLTVASGAQDGGSGFTLLLGRAQICLTYRAYALTANLIVMQEFQRLSRPLYCLSPHADPFGSIVWRDANTLLMTNELIIKRLFEDLTRAALEAAGSDR